MRENKGHDGLIMKFGGIFLVFTLVTLIITGFATYAAQTDSFEEQHKKRLHNIGTYISAVLQEDGDSFILYQEYMLKHGDEVPVPYDFTVEDIPAARRRFEELFAERYPGMVLGEDVMPEELPKEIADAYAIYMHERYLSLFEEATKAFELEYTYYIVPEGENGDVCFLFDAVREGKYLDGEYCVLLCYRIDYDKAEYPALFETWETGEASNGYHSFDNEFGKTRAWFVPLIVNGQKQGVICTEISLDSFNRQIIAGLVSQILMIAAILFLASSVTLGVIDHFYIKRIERLAHNIDRYASEKDPKIAGIIERDSTGHDEVAALYNQTAAMIHEMDNYMNRLMSATAELTHTRARADTMAALAKKDALTGVGSRVAYDEEVDRLTRRLLGDRMVFGIAMADVNYLKRTNDTYGHEQGNITIRNCGALLCRLFTHSSVYRIGGDEFVVILEDEDCRNAAALVARFDEAIRKLAVDENVPQRDRFSAAIGYALYDPAHDSSVEDVFKRADAEMYAKKREMKAVRE